MKKRKLLNLVLLSALALSNQTLCLAGSTNTAPLKPAPKKTAGVVSKQANTAAAKSASSKQPTKTNETSSNRVLKAGSKEFLWKITNESGGTLFLLGTMHIVKKDFYPLPVEMEKAFEKSRAILLELDMTKQDPDKTRMLLRQNGVYQPPDNLSQHIGPDLANEVEKYCARNKLPLANVLQMKPWLVALTIMQSEFQRLGYSAKEGIDLHFTAEANSQGKKLIGLETEEFQLKLFAGLSDDLQNKMLNLTLVDLDLLEKDADDLMKAWKDGDDVKMDELTTKDLKEHPEFAPVQEKLLYERNITMAEKLEPYLKGSDTFICAVGSAHLVGNRSIIQILKDKGYKVTQVLAGDSI